VDKLKKGQVVASLQESFSGASTIIVTHYKGLTVAEITNLRRNMRKLGAEFKVTKNSLTKLALKDTQYEKLSELLEGPVAIAYSSDPVAAAKGIVEFANDNEKLIILGGAVGSEAVDVSRIKTLAKLPSLDQLRSKIIGMISTPATRIACILQAPGSQVARVISAHAKKNG
jgi:large subunit ribosomal protein L10